VPKKKHGGRPQGPVGRVSPRAGKKSFYKSPAPKSSAGRATLPRRREIAAEQQLRPTTEIGHPIPPSHFTVRDDGSIKLATETPRRREDVNPQIPQNHADSEKKSAQSADAPRLCFSSDHPFIRLYHGNCLELLDAIAAKYPEGRFDAIFADPPYFLSNGGITCHAGKMVKVDKGDWDISRGPELNHEFNREWLARCQRVLKPNGTIWVSGTHHVIFSIGYALQQLGYKILNDIAWEKPNPPPNLSCRYFTHSTETILWAAKNEKSKHVFNYQDMRKVTGKQMKTVWRDLATEPPRHREESGEFKKENLGDSVPLWQKNVWTINAPSNSEKALGKHPTQKPVALIERCLLASTNEGDLVLDPFLGGGTTAIAAIKLKRACVGIELDEAHAKLAIIRANGEIISLWLQYFKVRVEVCMVGTLRCGVRSAQRADPTDFRQNDLDLFSDSINGSRRMADVPQIETERIYHECKFVFLSAAQVERGAVVHTTVDVSLQEAWAKTPNGKKRETTHVVRCETEIFRVKSS
jgi:site-specific DNA-methyltransferase (adenine-specific)